MKISIGVLLIILSISSGAIAVSPSLLQGLLSLLSPLGKLILPGVCDALNNSEIPSLIKDLYNLAAGGLTCHIKCTRPNGDYHLEGPCDSDALSDTDKVTFCQNGMQVISGVAAVLGCPAYNCTINAAGQIFYSATCTAPTGLLSIL